jgi:hypothetical protein
VTDVVLCVCVGGGGSKSTVLLEISQASPTRPSDKNIVKVTTMERLEITDWERGSAILVFWISVELHNLQQIKVVHFTAEGLNFTKLKSRGLYEKHSAAIWNFGTVSAFSSFCIFLSVSYHRSNATHQKIWYLFHDVANLPVTVAVQTKAWNVFALSNTGIVGSIPTQDMNFCLVYSALVFGSGLAMGWSPVQGVLPTVLD